MGMGDLAQFGLRSKDLYYKSAFPFELLHHLGLGSELDWLVKPFLALAKNRIASLLQNRLSIIILVSIKRCICYSRCNRVAFHLRSL